MSRALGRLLVGGCLIALAAPGYAQTVPDASSAERQGEAGDGLPGQDDPSQSTSIKSDVQSGRATATSDGDIVVTGTRIVRPNNRSAAPITSTTANDIAIQGATNLEDVLNRLPQVQPNSEQNYADSEGRQRIKLRSLGYERTLTLIDGLRVGLQQNLDVGIIPTQLVERIDVLSGGASSVYGSDAISGVVNFILKKNFDGLAVNANYNLYNHDNRSNVVTDAAGRAAFASPRGLTNDGGRIDLSLAAGKNLFGGAVNVTGFVNYRHADQVSIGDRSYSACEVTQPVKDGPLSCTVSTYTPVGTIVPQSGPNSGRILVNDPSGARNFVGFNTGRGTAANPFDDLPAQRSFNRINAGGFLTARISDDVELYSNALWYRDKSFNTLPRRVFAFSSYGSTPFTVNCANPFLSASQAGAIGCSPGSTGTVPIDVRYRFDGLPPVENRFVNEGVRISGGLRGRVLDDVWSYDVAGMYSRNKLTSAGGAFPDFDRVNRSLKVVNVNGVPTCADAASDPACVPFNAFAPYNNDAALIGYLFNGNDGVYNQFSQLWQGLATLSADLGRYGATSPLAKDGVAVAFASEFRAENYSSRGDEAYRVSNGGSDIRATQNVWEVNAEVQAPLVQEKR